MTLKLPIYLDHHATTPCDPRVFEAMRPYFSEIFGNPASGSHSFGWKAEEAVKIAREQVAKLIHADPKEIVWTSGTTESINLALSGVASAYRHKNHLITCVTEHRAVLDTAKYLESQGLHVTYLPVDPTGLVNPDELSKAITPQTLLISIMAANNEIGTIPPLIEIGKIAKQREVLFHVDAAQACGKIPVDVQAMGIDLLSMSAHKVYGPKGIGALYVRDKNPRVHLTPLFHGGGQERGWRSGTLAVQNIVGMGKAFEIAGTEMTEESQRLLTLREKLHQEIAQRLDGVFLNGHPAQRLPGNLNLSFEKTRSDALLAELRDIALSSGSACASGSSESSYVIRALGSGEAKAKSSIRFGVGRFNTEEEIDFVIARVTEAVQKLRK